MTAETVRIPDKPSELEELLNDDKQRTSVFANADTAREFLTKYARKFNKADKGQTKREAEEQAQRVLAQILKENGIKADTPRPDLRPDNAALRGKAHVKGTLYNQRAPGAKIDHLFDDDAATYLQSLWSGAKTLKKDQPGSDPTKRANRLSQLESIQNSFGSEVPADGGFLIPEVLRSQLLALAIESAIVRPRATVIPMESLRVPIPVIDDTSHVSSIFGGVTAYWTEEAAALTESQATFGRVVLDAKKLTAYAEIPNELMADASAISGFFQQRYPIAIAWFEDLGFMLGTGNGEPLGFINCPASVQQTAVAGQGANTIVWENITSMYARMLPQSLMSAVWICSIDTFPQLATMALSVGVGGGPVWIGSGYNPGNSGASSPPVTILGRPVLFTEKTPALGTTGDINFVDLSYYLLGDRQTMQIDQSIHYKFANDKTALRIIERVDGRPWLQSALTPHNGSSNTLTPFVQLSSTRT